MNNTLLSYVEYTLGTYSGLIDEYDIEDLSNALYDDPIVPDEYVEEVCDEVNAQKYSTKTQTKTQGTQEQTVEIKHYTLINGTDVNNMSDNDIFQKISDLTSEAMRLNKLGIHGPAMERAQADLDDKITELSNLVNGRYEAPTDNE